ncbi:hypothetical protein L1887_05744 [Cichorium endivia]|nr:hypothetical protein L1887_05744 [Cichorium endivia]
MEVAVDQRLPVVDTDVEDAVEVGLQLRKPHQYSDIIVHGLTKGDHGDGEQSENSAYLDENGGAVEDLDIHKIVSAIQSQATSNGKAETAIADREETKGRSELIEEEVVEEEIVELEFEKVAPKLHTHTMHCPNCDSHITKVVLRRKIIKPRPQITQVQREPDELLGCFSCFSLFTSAGNGRFNPFPIWSKPASSVGGAQPAGEEVEVSREDGNCFSVFRALWRPNVNDLPQAEPGENDGSNVGVTSKPKDSPLTGHVPSHLDGKTPGKHETSIDIPVVTSPAIQGQTQISERQDSTYLEILKSIVYGGLMEVIASLSVVASAAAADATTLSIVSLALANLIGGTFLISHNLWDLRNDCYKTSNQQTNEETRNKYKELLGKIENFPLHMFFAILSFLIFGIIPPVAYGYSFYETNDKDFTLLVVAAVSMICVGLLAIIKAYVDRCDGFWGYVKTILYYLTTAIVVSGVSYVIGDLVTRVIEKLGFFEMTPGVNMPVLSNVVSTNMGLSYY